MNTLGGETSALYTVGLLKDCLANFPLKVMKLIKNIYKFIIYYCSISKNYVNQYFNLYQLEDQLIKMSYTNY